MLIYIIEHSDDGIAQVSSTYEKAVQWIQENGEDWGGDDAKYSITCQYLDGDHNEYETFGLFDCRGNSLTFEPQ